MAKKVQISDLVLRDAHQSLHATRMTTADMLPICDKLDKIGYWSLEGWGGATYDSCIRFLNEDPWDRLRQLHKALPNTPIMMLLRGQNLLGYRHYADDVVDKFVETAAKNGIGVFRIFDANTQMEWISLRLSKQKAKTALIFSFLYKYEGKWTIIPVMKYFNVRFAPKLVKHIEEFNENNKYIEKMIGRIVD